MNETQEQGASQILGPTGLPARPARVAPMSAWKICKCGAGPDQRVPDRAFGTPEPMCSKCGNKEFD